MSNLYIKEIYLSYRYNYGHKEKSADVVQDILMGLLGQHVKSQSSVLDRLQPYIREFMLRHDNQPAFVAYLDQTLVDLQRFCTSGPGFKSPLVLDTTFNISDFYFTQSAYMNLSLICKDTGKHPWFPGPLLVHRNRDQEMFKYFWQVVKRDHPDLANLTGA